MFNVETVNKYVREGQMFFDLLHERKASEIGQMKQIIEDLKAEVSDWYDEWEQHAAYTLDADYCEGECYGDYSWDLYEAADVRLSDAKKHLKRLLAEERVLCEKRSKLGATAYRVAHFASGYEAGATEFDLIEDEFREEAVRRDTRRQRERLISQLSRGRSDAALVRSRVVRETAKLRAVARRFERRRARRRKAAA